MDSSGSVPSDIFQIYRRYCDIIAGLEYAGGEDGYRDGGESQKAKFFREALAELLSLVHSRRLSVHMIFDELLKLMPQLDLMVDFSEFSHFYDFVFFMCRENGQKNITVSKAIAAWRIVLAGRFRLLDQWCEFVEKNQRHNISEDTWKQVLAFSRCVHENLEGYDPEGAWPVLIDDFVEHMYRVKGSNDNLNLFCNCGDSEAQLCTYEDPLPGLKIFPGLKRKLLEDFQRHQLGNSDPIIPDSTNSLATLNSKRRKTTLVNGKPVTREESPTWMVSDACTEISKHNSPLNANKPPCVVEGCLSKGFAGLLSNRSRLTFDRDRRVFYT